MKTLKTLKTLKAEKKQNKGSKSNKYSQPKIWLRKPEEEKKIQDYYYVKLKNKTEVKKQVVKLLKNYNG